MAEDEKILVCPACHKRLEKIKLESVGITVDICLNGCGGIYFNNKEMPIVMKSSEAFEELKKACDGKEFNRVDDTEVRECPFCGSNMVKNYTSYSKEVQIDECYRCGGKFLDNGELQKINLLATDKDTEYIMSEVRAMFGEDIKQVNAKNVVHKIGNSSNKRRSFFINLADKFFRR